MDLDDKPALAEALDRLKSVFCTEPPASLSVDYFSGKLTDPGIYEKVGSGSLDGHPLWAYLLITEGFLRQPDINQYYDIFRAARAIPLLRGLDIAVAQLREADLSYHVERAVAAKSFDALDETLFEIIVAAAYQRRFQNGRIDLIKATPEMKTPDFAVRFSHSSPLYVECKRVNRNNDFHARLRIEARELLSPVLQLLGSMTKSGVTHVVFKHAPSTIAQGDVLAATRDALRRGMVIDRDDFSLEIVPLGPPDYDFLYPSPKYFQRRFGYDPERWHGLIPALLGKRLGPSCFESVAWDSAVLWRIENEESVWKAGKFNYKLFFDGLEQLAQQDGAINLHIWFERETAWGHRAQHLREFCRRLEKGSDAFSHIIFNETHANVTPRGYFDFQEHASAVGGSIGGNRAPPIMQVFTGPEDGEHEQGEWGVGAVLQSLDDIRRSEE